MKICVFGAGAIGGFLSGSGSAIVCLALKSPEAVAEAMQHELPDSEVKLLRPDNTGFAIEPATPVDRLPPKV